MSSRCAVVFLILLAGCSDSSWPTTSSPTPSASPAAKPPEAKLDPEQAKLLVSEAAGIKREDLDKLASGPEANIDPDKLENLPLTLLCYFLDRSDDFHYHGKRSTFSQYALAIGTHKEMAYGSIILPDQVAKCTCETMGETANGTLSFKNGNLCEGQVEFTARHHDGQWRVEQLWLPTDEIGVYLGADGHWKMKAVK
jgi:hypothetical protein